MPKPHKDHAPHISANLAEWIARCWPQDERPDPKATDRDRWIREGELKAMRVLLEVAKRQERGGMDTVGDGVPSETVLNPTVHLPIAD